jgi:hypothetical protein
MSFSKHKIYCPTRSDLTSCATGQGSPEGAATAGARGAATVARTAPKSAGHFVAKYRQRHPLRAVAHRELQKALSKGTIVRPGFCADCLRAVKPEAHHDDYAQPLKVRWLCQRCHRIADGERAHRERAAEHAYIEMQGRQTLTQREFWEKLGLSRAQYYRLKNEGWFAALESPIPRRYSRVKVDVYLHGRQFVDAVRNVHA